jgi:hypothetical protein
LLAAAPGLDADRAAVEASGGAGRGHRHAPRRAAGVGDPGRRCPPLAVDRRQDRQHLARNLGTAPRRAALATDGRAPAARAARSQRIQASEPVTNSFGPRLSPTRSANG